MLSWRHREALLEENDVDTNWDYSMVTRICGKLFSSFVYNVSEGEEIHSLINQ